MFQAIDSLALSTVTGGGKKEPPAPTYPNCVAFCGTNITGARTGKITVDNHSTKRSNETTNGVKANVSFPAIGAGGGNVE